MAFFYSLKWSSGFYFLFQKVIFFFFDKKTIHLHIIDTNPGKKSYRIQKIATEYFSKSPFFAFFSIDLFGISEIILHLLKPTTMRIKTALLNLYCLNVYLIIFPSCLKTQIFIFEVCIQILLLIFFVWWVPRQISFGKCLQELYCCCRFYDYNKSLNKNWHLKGRDKFEEFWIL